MTIQYGRWVGRDACHLRTLCCSITLRASTATPLTTSATSSLQYCSDAARSIASQGGRGAAILGSPSALGARTRGPDRPRLARTCGRSPRDEDNVMGTLVRFRSPSDGWRLADRQGSVSRPADAAGDDLRTLWPSRCGRRGGTHRCGTARLTRSRSRNALAGARRITVEWLAFDALVVVDAVVLDRALRRSRSHQRGCQDSHGAGRRRRSRHDQTLLSAVLSAEVSSAGRR